MNLIVAVALAKDGVIMSMERPHRHFHLKQQVENPDSWEEGFLTSDGTFVRRIPAARLALKAGQIQALKFHPRELFSEDLW